MKVGAFGRPMIGQRKHGKRPVRTSLAQTAPTQTERCYGAGKIVRKWSWGMKFFLSCLVLVAAPLHASLGQSSWRYSARFRRRLVYEREWLAPFSQWSIST